MFFTSTVLALLASSFVAASPGGYGEKSSTVCSTKTYKSEVTYTVPETV